MSYFDFLKKIKKLIFKTNWFVILSNDKIKLQITCKINKLLDQLGGIYIVERAISQAVVEIDLAKILGYVSAESI